MITVTNINQQSPSFKARVKMSKADKLGEFLKEHGINSNKALLGSTATLGSGATVSMANPNLISTPVAAQYGIFGGMASTMGLMLRNLIRKSKLAKVAKEPKIANKAEEVLKASLKADAKIVFKDKDLGTFQLTQKGIKQYLNLCRQLEEAAADYEYNKNFARIAIHPHDYIKNRDFAEQEVKRINKELNLLQQLGELPE